jgi:hypothetical protein
MSVKDMNNKSIMEMKAEFTEKLKRKLGDKQATLNQPEQNGFVVVEEEGMPTVVEEVPKNEQYNDNKNMEPLAPIPEADKTSPVD